MKEHADYVVLEWVYDLLFLPHYAFATLKHAEELGTNVRWLQRYPSLEMAARAARELNLRHEAI